METKNNYLNKLIEFANNNKTIVANFDINENEINDHLMEIAKIYKVHQQCNNNMLHETHFHFILNKNKDYIYLESYLCPKLMNNHNYLIKNNYWYSNIDLNKNCQQLEKDQIMVEQNNQNKIKLINLLLNIKRNKTNVHGIYVYGDFNIGKSYLITAFCNSMALQNKSIIYIVLNQLIIDIKKSIHHQDDFINDIIEKMIAVDILVIDEFDQESYNNYFHNQILYNVLNCRNENNKITIFIARKNPLHLKKLYHTGFKTNYQIEQFLDRINRLIENNIFDLSVKKH